MWIPRLIEEKWAIAVDSLLADGVDVPAKDPPTSGAASSRKATGSVRGTTRVKVYQATDEESSNQSWGDKDRDVTVSWVLDVQIGGRLAPEAAHSARLVIDRILALHRANPHADWHRFESWRSIKREDFADFQRVVFTVRLARRGEILPTSIAHLGA